MAISLEQFVKRLTDSGLMTADEFSSLTDSLPPDKKDAQALAKVLFRLRKLTKYQVELA